MRRATIVVPLAALASCTAHVPRAPAAPARAAIVGGTPTTIDRVPWRVYLRIGDTLACGGSVLDARRVLSAAHCVVAPGQTAPRPASSITVLAGFTDVTTWGGGTPPAGTQVAGVATIRVRVTDAGGNRRRPDLTRHVRVR